MIFLMPRDVFFLNCNKYIPETMYGALEANRSRSPEPPGAL